MGFFGKKDATKTQEVAPVVNTEKKVATVAIPRDVSGVIMKPLITEKAAVLTDLHVYTFEVRRNASKYEVRDAVKKLYNITPVRVNVVNKKPRHYMSRSKGRSMMEHGMRKAYVYLKKGDRIELV